ncbi:hypothetical protein [Pseudactinotalea sp. HY158]|uniref:DUF6907 domain-containing protein n=1 Tax=Pseudactinotalea sp. HY158 TaxID=2654547 RepID=UPI00129D0AE8|nr:hypothetical protein [Pseudactinotalea sp. HY158]QGH68699.1 hypothetical protein GCE65_03685 [Pseudactinotalea sp. HY158]
MENEENRGWCPAWCVAQHSDEDQLADRWHRSRIVTLPMVERGHLSSDNSLAMVEMMVVLEQHVLASGFHGGVCLSPCRERERCS